MLPEQDAVLPEQDLWVLWEIRYVLELRVFLLLCKAGLLSPPTGLPENQTHFVLALGPCRLAHVALCCCGTGSQHTEP